jgi:hypothetical protein
MSSDPFAPQDLPPVPPSFPYKTPERLNAEFDRCCTSGAHLFQDRNKEYDGAFRKYGLLGVVFEILGILSRLPPMTIWKKPGDMWNVTKLRDLFLDLHNYSNMALMVLEENNWDGRNPIWEEGAKDAH